MKVFWSWQSDNDEGTGRYFVRDVLNDLAKELNNLDGTDEAERGDDTPRIEIDHDTKDVAGSPPIAETILRKIKQAAVFVADVTPIGETPAGTKKIPNPNVMLELGYAIHALGHERIVLVINEAAKLPFEKLPFDLGHLRGPVAYALPAGAAKGEKNAESAKLRADLKGRIRASLMTAQADMKNAAEDSYVGPRLSVSVRAAVDGQEAVVKAAVLLPIPTVDELRQRFPPYPLPDVDPPRRPKVSTWLMGDPGWRTWSRQEVADYNSALDAFYVRYQKYVQDLNAHQMLIARTFNLVMVLYNSGKWEGERMDVHLSMPPGVLLYAAGKRPVAPVEPTVPSPRGTGHVYATISHEAFEGIPSYLTDKVWTRVDVDKQTVRFHVDALKHGWSKVSNEFTVSLETEEAIGRLEFAYDADAANSSKTFDGFAVLDVSRDRDGFGDEPNLPSVGHATP